MSPAYIQCESPYKVLLDLLLKAMPVDDEVLAVSMDAQSGYAPNDVVVDASAVTVRAVTFGRMNPEQMHRFHKWPDVPVVKHWMGALEAPGKLRVTLHSIARPSV